MTAATVRPIRTEADYVAALARIDALMDAEFGSSEGHELDVLVDLVELYESKTFPLQDPTPIEAIKFRMEQAGLSTRDLIPLIGSRAKVSEVLTGKREITMQMARALREHLGIPAEVLLKRSAARLAKDDALEIQWKRFPLNTLLELGWIKRQNPNETAEQLLAPLAASGGGFDACATLFRKTRSSRANAKTDNYALIAWCWRVRSKADAIKLKGKFDKATVNPEFLQQLAKLSRLSDGPLQAQKFLAKHGIALVTVRHLPRTYLDGAALKRGDGSPVVAVTLRFDRIDHFWFCLFHELGHVAMHLSGDGQPFFDDLSLEAMDQKEKEADECASSGLIPNHKWQNFESQKDFSPLAVMNFADEVGVHPAIVAGRVRYTEKNFRLLSQFVGSGQIRQQFFNND